MIHRTIKVLLVCTALLLVLAPAAFSADENVLISDPVHQQDGHHHRARRHLFPSPGDDARLLHTGR
jgi:hypothetical protein